MNHLRRWLVVVALVCLLVGGLFLLRQRYTPLSIPSTPPEIDLSLSSTKTQIHYGINRLQSNPFVYIVGTLRKDTSANSWRLHSSYQGKQKTITVRQIDFNNPYMATSQISDFKIPSTINFQLTPLLDITNLNKDWVVIMFVPNESDLKDLTGSSEVVTISRSINELQLLYQK